MELLIRVSRLRFATTGAANNRLLYIFVFLKHTACVPLPLTFTLAPAFKDRENFMKTVRQVVRPGALLSIYSLNSTSD